MYKITRNLEHALTEYNEIITSNLDNGSITVKCQTITEILINEICSEKFKVYGVSVDEGLKGYMDKVEPFISESRNRHKIFNSDYELFRDHSFFINKRANLWKHHPYKHPSKKEVDTSIEYTHDNIKWFFNVYLKLSFNEIGCPEDEVKDVLSKILNEEVKADKVKKAEEDIKIDDLPEKYISELSPPIIIEVKDEKETPPHGQPRYSPIARRNIKILVSIVSLVLIVYLLLFISGYIKFPFVLTGETHKNGDTIKFQKGTTFSSVKYSQNKSKEANYKNSSKLNNPELDKYLADYYYDGGSIKINDNCLVLLGSIDKIISMRNRVLTKAEIKILNSCKAYIAYNDTIYLVIYHDNSEACIRKQKLDEETGDGFIKNGSAVVFLGKSSDFFKIKEISTGKIGYISYKLRGENTLTKLYKNSQGSVKK